MLNGGKFLQQQQLIWMSGSTFWNMSKEVVCRRGSVFRTAFTLLRSLPFYREIRDRVFVSTNWSFLPLFSTLLLLFPLFLSFFLSFFLCLSLRDGLKMIGPFFFLEEKREKDVVIRVVIREEKKKKMGKRCIQLISTFE